MVIMPFEESPLSSGLRFGKYEKRKFVSLAEMVGMGIMVFGIVLLFQPFYIQLFKWGFPFLLVGYTTYNIFAHIPR